MFGFRRFLPRNQSSGICQELQALRAVLEEAVAMLHGGADTSRTARLDELERRQALWEAEVEGRFLKAEAEKRQARAAEERTRVLASKLDQGDPESESDQLELPEEYAALLRGGDGDRGEEGEVQPVRAGVGGRRKARRAAAQRYKFGG